MIDIIPNPHPEDGRYFVGFVRGERIYCDSLKIVIEAARRRLRQGEPIEQSNIERINEVFQGKGSRAMLDPRGLPKEQEQYELFSYRGKALYQYDYRHTNGKLFTCVKKTLDECRMMRDKWIKTQQQTAQEEES